MQILNHSYKDNGSLSEFILTNKIPNSNKTLVQCFYSNKDDQYIKQIVDYLKKELPNAILIGSSTAGLIDNGKILDNDILLSFSIFNSSYAKNISYNYADEKFIIENLNHHLTDKTKLILLFSNTFRFNPTSLLQSLASKFPNIVVAGGNAADDYKFQKVTVFDSNTFDCDIALAIIDSDYLQVETKYLFNWLTIGKNMLITKASGQTVYEINNKKAIDVYRHYLGDEMADNLTTYGIEFPLVYKDGDIDIARAAVAFNSQDGSITFAGEIPENTNVKFGYANIGYIDKQNTESLSTDFLYKHEGMYVYSCAARRKMLGNFLDAELYRLNSIATNCGFITYGEFFYDKVSCHSNLLNITTTIVVLNETSTQNKNIEFEIQNAKKDKQDVIFKALTSLISKTSDELDENIYYLEQFKKAVDESSIFSITDNKGYIKEVNKNFEAISGYKASELIGQKHSIVRHPDTPSATLEEIAAKIKSGNIWKGLLKNKRKDNSTYYVLSEIAPIYYKNGEFREYINIKNDVTELEEYKTLLKQELDTTNKALMQNIHYEQQYENAINSTIAIIKTDINNKIIFVNEQFCKLSGYPKEYLLENSCKDILNKDFDNKQTGIEVIVNTDFNKNDYVVICLTTPIYDLDETCKEYMYIMHDITEISKLNNEIIDTQKEVVFMLGAVCETRSKETGNHVKRVAEYSYLLANLCGLSEHDAILIKHASPMHDIGKIGIPDEILNKPAKLTEQEFEIMKTHTQLGYDMLKHSNREIMQTSATIAYTHHEKWDGSGYPRGLSKQEIPLAGRITAIADVFDALGNDRVYKKAWELDKILELFKEQSGKHFDPELIELFMQNLDKFLEIRSLYK